ncbi:hypothetical protein CONPUDRAFT_79444 [Coniophora puteana RWD-64-598 SS2]|uniref:Uncharacterized protein n=1 Tax=Coniophora puteana (strain RWD-64-598) TaxID=741705 RepID=A0A5M3N7I4_CONPW|nr:uncharacterized protein CONPUDRAFT_79444 [Coniophora puteana RWD-64-598 SS2]EIW87402.1 hypothetical protein CONPUDRAFT_79444 [Coniophora puteana RWD-64-598 SS2]
MFAPKIRFEPREASLAEYLAEAAKHSIRLAPWSLEVSSLFGYVVAGIVMSAYPSSMIAHPTTHAQLIASYETCPRDLASGTCACRHRDLHVSLTGLPASMLLRAQRLTWKYHLTVICESASLCCYRTRADTSTNDPHTSIFISCGSCAQSPWAAATIIATWARMDVSR